MYERLYGLPRLSKLEICCCWVCRLPQKSNFADCSENLCALGSGQTNNQPGESYCLAERTRARQRKPAYTDRHCAEASRHREAERSGTQAQEGLSGITVVLRPTKLLHTKEEGEF